MRVFVKVAGLLIILLLFIGGVKQRFVERGVFSWSKLDSVLLSNRLPASLSSWRAQTYKLARGEDYHQWVLAVSYRDSVVKESVYVIEARDSVFLFVHRDIRKD